MEMYNIYRNEYLKYREIYGDKVCVFLLKGHFWEFYGQQDPQTLEYLDTVKEICDIMGIKISVFPKGAPQENNGIFAGVPLTTLDKWAGRLTQAGWTVVVMEEIRDSTGAKVLRRETTRILSPGTHTETAEAGEAFYIGCVWLSMDNMLSPPKFGASVADLTTGHVYTYDGIATGRPDAWYTDDLRHFFQVHKPRELLIFWDAPALLLPPQETLLSLLLASRPLAHIRQVTQETEPGFKAPFAREGFLRRLFQPKTALPIRTWLGFTGPQLSERALCSLLRFSEDHATSLANQLQKPERWCPSNYLRIVNSALQQLNFTTSDPTQQSILSLFTSPRTAMGKRALTQHICTPLTETEAIQERLDKVQHMLSLSKGVRDTITHRLQAMFDIARLHRRVVRGSIIASDILQLADTYTATQQLLDDLKSSPFLSDSDCLELVRATSVCLTNLTALFDRDKATKSQNNPENFGFLQDSEAPETAKAEKRISEIYLEAETWLSELSRQCGLDLTYKALEHNTFTIQITKNQGSTFKLRQQTLTEPYRKVVKKDMASGCRLECPTLEKFQKELDSAQQNLKRALQSELSGVCVKFISQTQEFYRPIETWITGVDISLAIALTSENRGWVAPKIIKHKQSSLVAKAVRHPLIEAQKSRSKLVTHDVKLGGHEAERGWLLYGMNASGKSSLMKSIGILVLLAQAGCPVPAQEFHLSPFKALATRILNQDNLWAGLSSFAVEMSELREIFSIADSSTLVLGDELCSGTESVSATAIVAAGLQWLLKAGSCFVLATHLHDLMKFRHITDSNQLKVWHLRVEYDQVADRLVYHRDLRPGSGTTLYGLEVAKALHLPHSLLEDAFEFRRNLLGEVASSDASISSWNSDLTVSRCEKCGSAFKPSLEVHHIQERHMASPSKRNQDGTGLNNLRNLVVLCDSCHDSVHSGMSVISEMVDTSEGPMRLSDDTISISPSTSSTIGSTSLTTKRVIIKKQKTTLSEETLQKIRLVIKGNPGLSTKLLQYQIKKEQDIDIKESELKSLFTNKVL